MGVRRNLWLVPLLAVSFDAIPQGVAAQETQPPFRTEAEAVVVDAVVRDGAGRPVRCLAKSDFRLVEDGVEQQIAAFEAVGSADCRTGAVRASGQNRTAIEASTPVPVTAVVFHELGPEARAAAFRAARVLVGEHRAAGEFVGVFALDFAVHTMTSYTRDESVVLAALRRAAMRPGCPEAVTGTIANAEGRPTCPGSVGEITAKATLSGLQAVVRSLAPLPGRKNVLVFSEGFRISTGESAVDQLNALVAMANQYGVTLHAIDAAGLRTMDWRQEARRRLSSYAGGEQGPGGLATRQEDANALLALDPTAPLARLADGTGGEFVSDTNDLPAAVGQLAADMHQYYQLSYQPSDQSRNRAHRRIELNVSLPGAVVRTRSGYYSDRERHRNIPVLSPADAVPHLILDSGAKPLDFDMVTSLRYGQRDVEVHVSVAAAGLTFTTNEGRFDAGVTMLARAVGSDKNVLAVASDTRGLSGPVGALADARGRNLEFAGTLPLRDARTIEIVACDLFGRRASVKRIDLNNRPKQD